jgi:hypothetical protein
MTQVIRVTFSAILWLTLTACGATASDDPCENYVSALAYTRSSDLEPVELTIIDERTSAKLTIKVPKTFVANSGNLTSGRQCQIALEVFWPDLSPAGPSDFKARHVRDRLIGNMLMPRPLTILVQIERREMAKWYATSGYCGERMKWKELEPRPFGLRALDDGSHWPKHIQADGTYRNMKDFASFPLDEADVFYFVDGAVSDMVRISCSRGAPRCQMETALGGFSSVIFFNQEDLPIWRELRSKVTELVDGYTISKLGSEDGPHANSFYNPDPRRIDCMREMLKISGKEGQLPTLDVTKAQRPHLDGVQELQTHGK